MSEITVTPITVSKTIGAEAIGAETAGEAFADALTACGVARENSGCGDSSRPLAMGYCEGRSDRFMPSTSWTTRSAVAAIAGSWDTTIRVLASA